MDDTDTRVQGDRPRRTPFGRRRPPTILFAQELGAGFGHLTNLIAVARHFPEARRIFVLRQPDPARPVLDADLGPDIPCLPAPRVDAPPRTDTSSERSMAEVLEHLGFADGAALATAVAAWRDLLNRHEPDLVVADYAPTLRIATAGRIPGIVLSNGFCLPPDGAPVRPFREPAPASVGRGDAEARILFAANAVRRLLGLAALPRFTSLLHGDETFVTSFPETDVFAERRATPSIDPLNVPRMPPGPALRDRTGPHVFAYLGAHEAAANPVLSALNGLALPIRIFVRDIDPHALVRHCAPQVEICTSLVDFAALLPRTRLVIHHGTQGTAAAALLAGTPQLLVPNSLDGELTSERLCAAGVGGMLRIEQDADPALVRAAIERVLVDPDIERCAREVAGGMQARRTDAPEKAVVEACRRVLGRRKP